VTASARFPKGGGGAGLPPLNPPLGADHDDVRVITIRWPALCWWSTLTVWRSVQRRYVF